MRKEKVHEIPSVKASELERGYRKRVESVIPLVKILEVYEKWLSNPHG